MTMVILWQCFLSLFWTWYQSSTYSFNLIRSIICQFLNLVLCHDDLAIAEHELRGSMDGNTLVDISNPILKYWIFQYFKFPWMEIPWLVFQTQYFAWFQIRISQRCSKKIFCISWNRKYKGIAISPSSTLKSVPCWQSFCDTFTE